MDENDLESEVVGVFFITRGSPGNEICCVFVSHDHSRFCTKRVPADSSKNCTCGIVVSHELSRLQLREATHMLSLQEQSRH